MKIKDTRPFAQKHPKWNTFFGFMLLIALMAGGYFLLRFLGRKLIDFINLLITASSKLDAVIIVALITAAVTIISGIISKIIDFKDGIGVARRRALERRAFVAHKLLLLQPQQVVVVRLGSLCSSSHTAKNFAFIFDMQALIRLFLPCGSPCVRSTSTCAVLLRSWRTKRSGIMREMSLLCEHRVLPPAEQFRGFPQTKCRGGTE